MLLFGTMCGGISLMADLGVHIAQLALGQTDLAAAAGAVGAAGGAAAGVGGAAGLATTAATFTRTGGMLLLPSGAASSSTLLPALASPATLSAAAATLASGDISSVLLSGPAICLAAVLLVLLPMCLLRYIRQLEGAATCGVLMVLALVALLGYDAAAAGFPAIKDGSLPIWSIKVGCTQLRAVSPWLRPAAACVQSYPACSLTLPEPVCSRPDLLTRLPNSPLHHPPQVDEHLPHSRPP